MSLKAIAGLALAAFAVHGGEHIVRGAALDILWACNLSPLLLAIGCYMENPRVVAVPLLWLTYGTPIWLLDLFTGGDFMVGSILTHVGGLGLGVLAVKKLPMPKRSWAIATAAIVALMFFCRFATPPEPNINLSHAVWAGWEELFPRYDVYFAVVLTGATATFFVAEKIWRTL